MFSNEYGKGCLGIWSRLLPSLNKSWKSALTCLLPEVSTNQLEDLNLLNLLVNTHGLKQTKSKFSDITTKNDDGFWVLTLNWSTIQMETIKKRKKNYWDRLKILHGTQH